MIGLSDLERDALTELVNIGVSRAASSLRKMVGAQILLSVPSVEILTRRQAAALISERATDELIAVRQDFSGGFEGRALLIFPYSNRLDLVRAIVGEELSPEIEAEMERETLSEMGNIILNSCLGTIANMLRQTVALSLPELIGGDGKVLFELDEAVDQGVVCFLYINFSVRDKDIRGYIALLVDVPFVARLRTLINEFYKRVLEDEN